MPNDTLTPDRQLDTALERAPVPSQWLCCAACEQRIALREDAVSFDGGHQHRFLNPQRRAFRIALYARAPGCGHVGEDSEYFSWFPGYAWRVAAAGLGVQLRGAARRGRAHRLPRTDPGASAPLLSAETVRKFRVVAPPRRT